MPDLKKLREELAAVDRQVLELAARRERLAAEIGQIKELEGKVTRDFRQEKEVLERACRVAGQLGLSSDFARRVMGLLIEGSLTTQEKQRVVHQGTGSGRSVMVIGGAGRMGRWMVRFLASQSFAVEVADPAGPVEGFPWRKDWKESELGQDIIVVATPLGVAADVLEELARRRPEGLVFDIGSLKSPLRKSLQHLVAAGVKVTSLHPMFGAETELLSGRHVILVDLGVEEANAEAARLFSSTMAVQVSMTLDDHDRLIAYVLGLSHALNIAFFTALAESGEAAPRLARLSSTTFDAQLRVAASVARENPDMYFEIQSLNDFGSESLSALLYAVERLRSVVRSGDREGFAALMRKGCDYLDQRPM